LSALHFHDARHHQTNNPRRKTMPRIIEVIVSPQGETTVQTKGYAGSDCLQASKFIEQALGITVADRKTSEYYEPIQTEQQVQQ
jgi:hypothetical protein